MSNEYSGSVKVSLKRKKLEFIISLWRAEEARENPEEKLQEIGLMRH